MAERIFISFGRNGRGQYQASIEAQQADGGSHGYRFAGAKYDGMGTELFRAELDERDAREIRGYLNLIDPDEIGKLRSAYATTRVQQAELETANAELVETLTEIRECCLFAEDDGQIGVTEDPHIPTELFNKLCAILSRTETEGNG